MLNFPLCTFLGYDSNGCPSTVFIVFAAHGCPERDDANLVFVPRLHLVTKT